MKSDRTATQKGDLEAQKASAEKVDISSPLLEPDEHDHFSQRAPWLRAGVLGANDGLVSVASLMIGVGGGSSALHFMILAGLAGLVGGALSMAVGEYISVASQKDSEKVRFAAYTSNSTCASLLIISTVWGFTMACLYWL